MPYVERRDEKVVGLYANPQDSYAQEFLDDNHADVLGYINPPPPTADSVRAEAQRRIIALTGATDINSCFAKQLNAQMRATELTLVRALGGTWTPEQAAEAASLQALADTIKAIRAASNVMEPNPPSDYTSNSHWP